MPRALGSRVRLSIDSLWTGTLVALGAVGYGLWEQHRYPHALPVVKVAAIVFGAVVGLVIARLIRRALSWPPESHPPTSPG
jgi:hypothetical protein